MRKLRTPPLEELLELAKKWNLVNYLRGYYQPQCPDPKTRYQDAQKLSLSTILKVFPHDHPTYKKAKEQARMLVSSKGKTAKPAKAKPPASKSLLDVKNHDLKDMVNTMSKT